MTTSEVVCRGIVTRQIGICVRRALTHARVRVRRELAGPVALSSEAQMEWRRLTARWMAALVIAPGLLLAPLSDDQLMATYLVLLAVVPYNLGVRTVLLRRPQIASSGWMITAADDAFAVAMIMVSGGFDSPLVPVAYLVTMLTSIRHGFRAGLTFSVFLGVCDIAEGATTGRSAGLAVIGRAFWYQLALLSAITFTARYLRSVGAAVNDRLKGRIVELKELNQELEAFGYSISHDLKAPLRSVDTFSRALMEDYGDALDPRGRDYLMRVQTNAARMTSMTNALLILSRVVNVDLRQARVDLSKVASSVLSDLARESQDRHVQFQVRSGCIAYGDPGLLEIVITNLIGNAWKFSRKTTDAHIEFGRISDGSRQIFFVRDNGVGFDIRYSNRLFVPFQRFHGRDEFEGTGVGLATAYRIVQKHQGEMWVDSEVGKGTTVFFSVRS